MFLVNKLAAAGTVAGLAAIWLASCQRFPAVGGCGGHFGAGGGNYLKSKAGRLNMLTGASPWALSCSLSRWGRALFCDNLQPFSPAGWRGVMESAALLFFAYTDFVSFGDAGRGGARAAAHDSAGI